MGALIWNPRMLLALAVGLALAQARPEPVSLAPVPNGVVRAYLVRHGQAFSNLDPAPDLPPDQLDRLTALGREQAQWAARALAGHCLDLILSSPAGRARETAEEMRRALGVPVRVEPRLRPLELGRSGAGAALDWDQRIAEWKAGRDPAPPGGESLAQLGQRVLDVVRDEHRRKAGRSLAVVAHSDVISAFLAAVRGDPGARAHPFSVRNGSISVVELGREGRLAVLFANRLPDEVP